MIFDNGTTKVYFTDVMSGIDNLEDQSINMIVTSPPYFGLRSYLEDEHENKGLELGTEKNPKDYVENLVSVFRALWSKLRNDGTLWLNISDTYAANRTYQVDSTKGGPKHSPSQGKSGGMEVPMGLKSKDLIGIPWRVAFALQDDGWYLRSDIIWQKPNCMPSSVKDRPTSSHEYIFLLSKKPKYYYDADAIREPAINDYETYLSKRGKNGKYENNNQGANHLSRDSFNPLGRNKRDVWNIPTKPYKGSHVATFPTALIEPCIKAGTSEIGNCPDCGLSAKRITKKGEPIQQHWAPETQSKIFKAQNHSQSKSSVFTSGYITPTETTGWEFTCNCNTSIEDAIPATVLDPFIGSGTTAQVAESLGRKCVGFEIDENCKSLIKERLEKVHG